MHLKHNSYLSKDPGLLLIAVRLFFFLQNPASTFFQEDNWAMIHGKSNQQGNWARSLPSWTHHKSLFDHYPATRNARRHYSWISPDGRNFICLKKIWSWQIHFCFISAVSTQAMTNAELYRKRDYLRGCKWWLTQSSTSLALPQTGKAAWRKAAVTFQPYK